MKKATAYILKKLIFLLVLLLVGVLTYNIAFNHSRVRVFVNDALTKRAQIILESEELDDLHNFFDEECISKDEALKSAPYENYNVTKYDYELTIDSISVGWIMPRSATVVATEKVSDVRGQFSGKAEEKGDSGDTPPDYKDVKYRVKMKKTNGRWYITSIKPIKELE